MTDPSQAERAMARRIDRSGPITFAEFMERALYGEGGYYAGDQPPIGGRGGDFITGSRMPLFAAGTLRLLTRLDNLLGEPAQLLEVGVGDARHLENLAALGRSGLFAHDRVHRRMPPGVTWVPRLDPGLVRGVVMSYELFDALPVHRLVQRDGKVKELFVDRASGDDPAIGETRTRAFTWVEKDLSDPALERLTSGVELIDGQIVDVSPSWGKALEQLAGTLASGVLITFDYGYPRPQLMDPRIRLHGTLACYRRHTVHRDPLVDAGNQDITAHVDFSCLREAGEACGLTTLGCCKLAQWMTGLNVFDDLWDADWNTREQAQVLLNPAGMGAEIKVLVQARGDVSTAGLTEILRFDTP